MPERRPSFTHVLRKTANRIRVRGPREVLGLGLGRLREAFVSDDELVFYARGRAGTPPERDDAFVQEAQAADAATYASDIGTDSAGTFKARLSETTRCFLVVDTAGSVLHASWVTVSGAWTRELRGYVTPPPGAAYVYESFTTPAARGRGIYPFALAAVCAHLPEGIETVWVAVEAGNEASLKAIGKAGFRQAFRVGFRRRLGRLSVGEPEGPRAEEGRRLLPG